MMQNKDILIKTVQGDIEAQHLMEQGFVLANTNIVYCQSNMFIYHTLVSEVGLLARELEHICKQVQHKEAKIPKPPKEEVIAYEQ
jgi:hypothetical protein